MRFLGYKFTQNALAAGARPRTPLGELKRSSRLPSRFQGERLAAGERGRRREGKKEIGVLGKGRREAREGKREKGGKRRGGGVCVIGVGG